MIVSAIGSVGKCIRCEDTGPVFSLTHQSPLYDHHRIDHLIVPPSKIAIVAIVIQACISSASTHGLNCAVVVDIVVIMVIVGARVGHRVRLLLVLVLLVLMIRIP